ncbi:hypothetical protein DFH07DRAFT_784617 [Mycena maculata]|uniref:Uncharacterized protein n=1 Tax=Mycena maculata TaxID=230809 RepID=A0AAD7HFT4_9AGAR|nr:hypothetical protein DFH07DRAFT_784617 [Mycena maculata]
MSCGQISDCEDECQFGLPSVSTVPQAESDIFGLANGLAPAQTGFSGLGLDLSGDQSPSPAYRLASPFDGLASPFARFAEKTGLCVFLVPVGLVSQSECVDYDCANYYIMPTLTPNTNTSNFIGETD